MTSQAAYDLNDSIGDNSWGQQLLIWELVEPGKLARANTKFGSYNNEVQPDGKTFRLTFNSGSDIRTCPTRFQTINRVQWEAEDHHRRLLAQQQQPRPHEATEMVIAHV